MKGNEKMKRNILITGAAGFIGSNFAHYFSNKYPEYNLIILDKLTYAGNLHNLDKIIDKITFVKGDICDFDLVIKIFKEEINTLDKFKRMKIYLDIDINPKNTIIFFDEIQENMKFLGMIRIQGAFIET